MHAYVENGSLVQFLATLPFTFKAVRRVPSLSVAEQAELGLVPVVDVTPPFDPLITRLAPVRPTITVLADRVEIVRQTEPIPAAELNARTAYEALRDDPRAAELLSALRAATPASINAFVDTQVTDLASARTMFKRVLLLLAAMSR